MIKREYYTVSELAEKLTKQFKETIEPKDLIHLGIKGKLPIYICPQFIGNNIPNHKFLRVIKLPKLYGANDAPLPGSENRLTEEYERLSLRSLEIVDKEGIYQLGKTVEVTGLWQDEGNSPYKPYISISGLDQNIAGLPGQQIITGLPVCLTDLFILGSDAQNLEDEYQASKRGQTNSADTHKTRINPDDYLKALGAMAIIADQATEGRTFRHGRKISANKFKSKAETLGLAGLTNIDKDITAALELPEIKTTFDRLNPKT